MKSPGEIAYYADLTERPVYSNGVPRPSWCELEKETQLLWQRKAAQSVRPSQEE